MTIADFYSPVSKTRSDIYNVALVLSGSILLALSAQIEFFLPFSPVPVTGQTFAVLFLGLMLGSKRGALAVMAYLLEGSAGLPVFSGGGTGAAHLVGPTGGYLIGFIAAAFMTGSLAERGWDKKPSTAALAAILGEMSIYLFGLPWLGVFVGFDNILVVGMLPFLPGAILKISLLMLVFPFAWKAMKK
ncbi:MAG TPA: biotin transporter BioY [Patescibacteria group bacterium]|nr:biotin transporter BioY [Patescibacteria group bacterium]